jgi:hypothetical protein
MFGRSRRIAAIALALSALCLAAASSASAVTVGSNLVAAPNGGVCPTSASGEASCSFVQAGLTGDHTASGGVQPTGFGVITSWRIVTGPATPATAGAKVRLRIIQTGGAGYAYGASPWEELPLSQPGIHVLPARLPIDEDKQVIGIDTVVTGSGADEAAAPFAYRASGAGSVWKYVPGLKEGRLPLSTSEGDLELLFNATVEPDRDHDGYGDRTQDRCPKDPRYHAHCDRQPPRTKLAYDRRQDFLRTGKVVVRVRSSEAGRIYASGQLEIPNPSVTWGIYSAHKHVGKGKWATLVLRVPAQAREHAARSFTHGRRVFAKVFVSATDRSGNKSRLVRAIVKP